MKNRIALHRAREYAEKGERKTTINNNKIKMIKLVFRMKYIRKYERAIIVCIKYSKKLDQPVHSGRADWLPANPDMKLVVA